MNPAGNQKEKKRVTPVYTKFNAFRRSIFGRVVLIIAVLSVFMYASYGFIFKSVYEKYLNTVILESGSNIGSLVEGTLYHSMLENDKKSLQNILDVIHTLPGIEDVTMYDGDNDLVFASFDYDEEKYTRANCKGCHTDLDVMFPGNEKSYKIITPEDECMMNSCQSGQRQLMIRSPILNSSTCYMSSCHAHKKEDVVLGSLIIRVPLEDLDEAVGESTMQFYLLVTLVTLLVVSLLILITKRQIKKPLNELIKASVAVSNGDRNTRVEIRPDQLDDIMMVSLAFNDMLDNLQTATTELENWSQQLEYKVQKKSEELGAAQNELITIERLASLGKLSSSVAHEINNPLAGILVYTKLVYKQLNNPELTEEKRNQMLRYLHLIETETKRCGDIVKGLLDFSKKDKDNFEPRNLHVLMAETHELMMHTMKIADISFRTEPTAAQDLIYCSPNQIKQCCMALLVNATEAVGENGEIVVRTSNPDPDSIKIELSDNGIGISQEDIPHIFEPFFSTKQEAHGIGLGLSITHGIIQNHNGKISVTSELGLGTTISIVFPLVKT